MHDVAIVGAGPAGAWTAYSLAQCGARVLVLDPSHPREKPCGGGITGRALALVAGAMPPLPAVTIRRARFLDAGTNASASVDLARRGTTEPLVVSGRAAFDGLLLRAAQRAGAELIAERATDIRRTSSAFEIETSDRRTHAARFIVGADGANSLVRRRLARPFTRCELSIATGFFVHAATSDEILLEFVADPPGYIWSFPRTDHLAVGICAAADAGVTSATLRARARQWIERRDRIGQRSTLEPYSWPVPSLTAGDLDRLSVAGPGWYLVGDAAGAVDPITREGIFFALQSAAFAADAIAAAHGGERRYVERMQSEVISELRRAAKIKDAFFRPRFTQLLLDALRRSEPIRAVMADLIAGDQSYRGLKRRLARTLEMGYAARAAIALIGRNSRREPGRARRDDRP